MSTIKLKNNIIFTKFFFCCAKYFHACHFLRNLIELWCRVFNFYLWFILYLRNVNLHEIFSQGCILNISEFRPKHVWILNWFNLFRLQTPVTRSAEGSRGRKIQATTDKGMNSICRCMERDGRRYRMDWVEGEGTGWTGLKGKVQDGEGWRGRYRMERDEGKGNRMERDGGEGQDGEGRSWRKRMERDEGEDKGWRGIEWEVKDGDGMKRR